MLMSARAPTHSSNSSPTRAAISPKCSARASRCRCVSSPCGAARAFDSGGVLLVDAAAFRREKLDAALALNLAEGIAHAYIGGMLSVRGEGSGALREGLARHLALSFIERAIDPQAADAQRARERAAYGSIALRDAPLAQLTPLFENNFATSAIKGANVWRLIERTMGREAFIGKLRANFQAAATRQSVDAALTLAALRAELVAGTAEDDSLRGLIAYSFDQPTEMDLLVGIPVKAGADQRLALRNTGAIPVRVTVAAYTNAGAPLTKEVEIAAKDYGEATFPASANITRVEIDPQKFYPQTDYTNDVAPKTPDANALFIEATQSFARADYTNAETKARLALARAPRMSEARITLARALLGLNRLDEAEREFKAALDDSLPLAATLAWANIGLGEILLRRNQAPEAARRFDSGVRADAEYAASLQARDGRLRAEAAARTASPVNEAARAFVQRLDAALKSGRKSEIDTLLLDGELALFSRGIVGNQPEIWTSEVRRTETLGGGRTAVDVRITARLLGRDQTGTAVYVLTDTPAGLRLADVQLFEVR
jgi:tetratricopeptide (TPR) repeat protein